MAAADILIPVYHEGRNILTILDHLEKTVRSSIRVLVCYDREDDPTIEVVRRARKRPFEIVLVKNEGRGVHGALMTGFRRSAAPAVIVYPADDDVNGVILDEMIRLSGYGCDIVAPSRFMKGGCMKGCRFTKAALVRGAAFTLYHLARIPTHDPTNGFRLFSRRALDSIEIESTEGFAFSIELLVKAHRRRMRIAELPASWFERKQGKSRFKILKWMPTYLCWYFYAIATTYFGRRTSASLAPAQGTAHGA